VDYDNIAALTLHGCGLISQRVLELDCDLLMAVPCCYSNIPEGRYLMSSYAGSIDVPEEMARIAILGSKRLKKRGREQKKINIKKFIEKDTLTQTQRSLLEISGYSTDIESSVKAEYLSNNIIRHSLLRKLFTRPIEALFSSDKAIYLNERGYKGDVFSFMPFSMSPRNHLIVGRKENY